MRTRRMRSWKYVTVNIVLIVLSAKLQAGESSNTVLTNLEVMKELARTVTHEIIEQATISVHDSIILRFDQDENVKIVQDPVLETLKAKGCSVFTNNDSLSGNRLMMEYSGTECRVIYGEMFRDGFLGTKRLKRNVTVQWFSKITRESNGEVLFGKTFAQEYADTVNADDVANLEDNQFHSTHAEIPSDTFFDRIIEPVVIIGATGVIVYLFFHIRG